MVGLRGAALAVLVAAIIVLAAAGVLLYTSTSPAAPTITSPSTSSVAGGYYFLVFTQKGLVQLASQSGTVVGFKQLYNPLIPSASPVQTYYWDEYPVQGMVASTLLIPFNNGTVKVFNSTSMKVLNTFSIGSAMGFIGVAVNPSQTLAALADGPSGIVEVMNLKTLQVVWQTTFKTPGGSTAYPCDVRWTPDGASVVVPMKLNDTVDVVNAQTGAITASTSLASKTQPYMVSVNGQGNQLAVELAGNKTVIFYSLPSLKPLGRLPFNSTFTPLRGAYTADGKFYLEDSGSTNVIAVISTSTFKQVNTINLPPSATPGLSDIGLTPDSSYFWVIQHGTPATGGIIYIIPSTNIDATGAAPSASVALTTAPAIVIPVSASTGTYLADQVLSPPVTGLHC